MRGRHDGDTTGYGEQQGEGEENALHGNLHREQVVLPTGRGSAGRAVFIGLSRRGDGDAAGYSDQYGDGE